MARFLPCNICANNTLQIRWLLIENKACVILAICYYKPMDKNTQKTKATTMSNFCRSIELKIRYFIEDYSFPLIFVVSNIGFTIFALFIK